MFHDLNIPYTTSKADLQRTLSFLAELSYSVAAISLPLPPGSTNQKQVTKVPELPAPPAGLKPLLTRLTLPLITNSDLPNARLQALQQTYDIVALRPTSEKTLLLATSAPEVDLISLDLAARWPFHFRPKMFSAAVKRGVWFEICYSPAIDTSSPASGKSGISSGDLIQPGDAATARRNLISNGTSLVRALRGGRNVIFSSEAKTILGLRGPMDVVNFGVLLGLSAEKGLEAVRDGPAMVVRAAKSRREGWRGVLLAVHVKSDSGDKPAPEVNRGVKRKLLDEPMNVDMVDDVSRPNQISDSRAVQLPQKPADKISKRQIKRLAKEEKQRDKTKVDGAG